MLYLLPNLLSSDRSQKVLLPSCLDTIVPELDGLIAESEKYGLSFLKLFSTKKPAHHTPIALYNEHEQNQDLNFLLAPLVKGEKWGFVSDAGMPCIADPGSELVAQAHKLHIPIQAVAGPSSLVLALMLSGLPSQRFAFRGYLSKIPLKREEEIRKLEKTSKEEKSTQVFIEAPYRNLHTFSLLLKALAPTTSLCVGVNLTDKTEFLECRKVAEWKKLPQPPLEKQPTIFLLYS